MLTEEDLLRILSAARAIVADPERWTILGYAEDEARHWTPVGSERAVRFNLEGALLKSAGSSAREALAAVDGVFSRAAPSLHALRFHAARPLTREQSLELLDQAITMLVEGHAGSSQSGYRLRAQAAAPATLHTAGAGSRIKR